MDIENSLCPYFTLQLMVRNELVFEELRGDAQASFREKQTSTDIALWAAISGTRKLVWSVSLGWFGLTGTDNWNVKVMTIDLVIRDNIQYILPH